ncbi:ribosome recycling factor [Flavobacteriaceae bacterium]|jgi:ribosome recycling factor|nr:ribosome recycling factor [Flavobacteriaceae bacterium]MDA9892672.1 ribosome recycling factor [Flavobacteriaceae bacterium]MDB2342247.1 ribosome recycling factor [Flavobacteriaceae bacterium]MDB3997876.1 ribosome recycling factor [Flavobacteriaceae bacterium]MDC0874265.1 ribosome recycling factor [Flavobacteriaceae bacterium]
MEEMDFIVDTAKESMEHALAHLEKEMLNLRAGKANPIMLASVKVDYYGTMTPISQVANINTPDGRTLTVQPWEKGMLQELEKAILVANLGFNPMNNGESIIINIPPLTEERRRDLAKLAKSETENAKIGIRAARKDANDEIKKSDASEDIQKNYEIDVQELTDQYNAKADEIFRIKEKEILTV